MTNGATLETLMGEHAALMRARASLQDGQATSQALRLSAISRISQSVGEEPRRRKSGGKEREKGGRGRPRFGRGTAGTDFDRSGLQPPTSDGANITQTLQRGTQISP